MILCPSCGAQNSVEHNFCARCGFTIRGATGQLTAQVLLENRYAIVRLLGKGGMGAVYLALDRRLDDMPVAVKEMSTAVLGPDELEKAVESFKREALLLVSLRHHALPRVTDFFSTDDGRWFLVMDYIEGETLGRVARSRGPIPEAEVKDWARQLCEVLGYLHGQEPPVIFRDLKPSNIMLTPDNRIKLIDFGIARHFKPGVSSDTVPFASAGFSPPEQLGKGQTDQRTDIYALGATMHYLLTGIDPGMEPFAFKPPDQVVATSPGLSELIMEMVEYEPGDRPADIGKVAGRLAKPPEDDGKTTEIIRPLPHMPKDQPPEGSGGGIKPPLAVVLLSLLLIALIIGGSILAARRKDRLPVTDPGANSEDAGIEQIAGPGNGNHEDREEETAGPPGPEIHDTLSDREKRTLNTFLSNFSETGLDYYNAYEERTASNSLPLIEFVQMHYYLNLHGEIEGVRKGGSLYYGILLDKLSAKLNRYFYNLKCTPGFIDFAVNAIGCCYFSDGKYLLWEPADGAQISTFSQVVSLIEEDDGLLKARIDVYTFGHRIGDGPIHGEVPDWIYDPRTTWSESNKADATKIDTATATLIRYEHLGKPSYQLVEYKLGT